jgi:CHAT domain-containing protein/sulfatase-modifying factor enzyme 1
MKKADEDCLDLELEIGPGSRGEYPIGVIHSVAGEAREVMHFPFTAPHELENELLKLKIALFGSHNIYRLMLSREEQTVQAFGGTLFRALFTGKVLNCYSNSYYAAQQQEKSLRLKLRILAPELATLPWEFLYDPDMGNFLCLSRNTPIVRYMELPQPLKPLMVNPPLRILGMIAAPSNLDTLNVEHERSCIEKALAPLIKERLVEVVWITQPTLQGLMAATLPGCGPWHAFHFIGHGAFNPGKDEGQIVLEDEDKKAERLSARKLAMILADHFSLRLVVLNACEGARGGTQDLLSSTASILVQRGIPAVLAMQYAITDRASITLSETFYKTLAAGLPVDIALAEARKALAIKHTLEWGTPVLYMRTSNGLLFDIKPEMGRNDHISGKLKNAVAPHEPEIEEVERTIGVPTGTPSPPHSSQEASVAPALPVFFSVPPEKPLCQMAVYLVTNHEFRAFVDANPYWQPGKQCYRDHKVDDQYLSHWTYDSEDLSKYPVVYVSWYAAQAYIDWLKKQLNIPLRLPTREEWELAAYAGRAWKEWLKEDLEAGRVNYKGTLRTIAPVGTFNPNPYGLFDILGNVYELCTTNEGVDACGGAFHCSAEQLIDPVEVDPNQCAEDVGFRLVQELNSQKDI